MTKEHPATAKLSNRTIDSTGAFFSKRKKEEPFFKPIVENEKVIDNPFFQPRLQIQKKPQDEVSSPRHLRFKKIWDYLSSTGKYPLLKEWLDNPFYTDEDLYEAYRLDLSRSGEVMTNNNDESIINNDNNFNEFRRKMNSKHAKRKK